MRDLKVSAVQIKNIKHFQIYFLSVSLTKRKQMKQNDPTAIY